MKQAGGKGRIGLWVIAHRNPLVRDEGGGFDLDAGMLFSYQPKRMWLFSIGARVIGTVGIGWVTKAQRQHDAAHEAGIEHTHP